MPGFCGSEKSLSVPHVGLGVTGTQKAVPAEAGPESGHEENKHKENKPLVSITFALSRPKFIMCRK